MRAAVYSRNGAAKDVLSLADLPVPAPAAGEVRVKVAWSGVNPSDVKTRLGLRATLEFPQVIPHCDGAGIIDAVGAGVSDERRGERVWLWNAQWGRAFGTAAEYITLPEQQAVALPDNVDLASGACLGVPALTAYHAVTMDGGVEGKTVLVAGGAGAVGHYAVQLAKTLGAAQVIATVSGPEKAALAEAAGADVVINYKTEELVSRVRAETRNRGVDRIVEVDIAANMDADLQMLVSEGDIVPYGTGGPVTVPFFPAISKGVRFRFFIVYNLNAHDRREAQKHLTMLMREGRLSHNVAVQLPLEDIVQAHEIVERGTAFGNVVLKV